MEIDINNYDIGRIRDYLEDYYVILRPSLIMNSLRNSLVGDVNKDGKVGASDYLLVRKYLLNLITLNTNEMKQADVNNDGKVTVLDYIEIRKLIIGK